MRLVTVAILLAAAPAEAAFVDHEAATFQPLFEVSGDWLGAGAGFVDFDGDGWDDVVYLHATSGIFLYQNEGPPDFTFTDVTAGSGLEGAFRSATGVGAADYDADGDEDLFMPEMRGLRLYRNDGGGAFTDVTSDALPGLPWYGISVAFADVDADGWIDVYAGSYSIYVDFPTFQECAPSLLLHNLGDGTFESVAEAWGVDDRGCTLGVMTSDFDRDGDPDLFAANDYGQFVRPNSLFRNDGLLADGSVRFTDVSASSGFDQRVNGMGLATADLDENGRADYFTTAFGRAVLLLGQEDGTFLDATEDYGVMGLFPDERWRVTWGPAFLDVEMDGVWDLAVASGYIPASPEVTDSGVQPSLLYSGLAPGWSGNAATEVAEEEGCAPPDASRSVAVGDFDRDGDEDLATAAIGGFAHLYRNDGARGPVARVVLHGTVSNPDAFGALLTLDCPGGAHRTVERFSGGAHASAHGSEMHVALAGCDAGGTLAVRWPSGLVEETAVDGNDVTLDLVEPSFLEVTPAWLPADGASESEVRIAPLEGSGRAVTVSATAGSVSAVVDQGDGTYLARVTAPAAAGDAALTVTVDGVAYAGHPRVRFFPAGGNRTTLHLSPAAYVPDATDVVATVVPRDDAGAPVGGASVDLDLDRGVVVGALEEEADGRYRATIHGTGGGPLVVRARVDGVVRASAQIPQIAAVDPARTLVTAEPGYVAASDLDAAEVDLVVLAHDGLGDVPPGSSERDAVVLDSSGEEIPITDEGGRGLAFVRTVRAADLAERGPATVVVDGVAIDKTVEVVTYDDPSELAAYVDPLASTVGPFHQSLYADGEDTDWIAAQLRDADGDIIPLGDYVDYVSDAATTIARWASFSGVEGKAKIRAGDVPGDAWIEVELDGVPTGAGTTVSLLPARTLDLSRIHFMACIQSDWFDLDVDDDLELLVTPRWEDRDLVGSAVPVRATIDGADVGLSYDERGIYAATIPLRDDPGAGRIHVEMTGTDAVADLDFEVGFGPDPDGELGQLCASSALAGGDAGPDAGIRDDAGSDAAVPSDEAGAPVDAAPSRQSARGSGCACRSAGGGDTGLVLLLYLVALPAVAIRSRRG